MIDDGELLARYAARGADAEEAFATLVQRHIDLVYSAALRRLRNDAHAAADVTQQVFVALARRAPRLGREIVLPAWLLATTRNLAVDFIRLESSRRAREREVATMNEHVGEESASSWERLSPLLDTALDELREADRTAVVLRFFSQRPFVEVGRALGVSEDAARMRVERALEKLRTQLSRRGVTSTSAALAATLGANAAHSAPAGMASAVSGAALSVGVPAAGAFAGLAIAAQTKWAAAILGSTALLTSGFAVLEFVTQRTREAELARLEEAHARLRAQTGGHERQAFAAERELEEARDLRRRVSVSKPALPSSGPTPAVVTNSENASEPRSAEARADALMARYPAIRQALLGWQVAKVKFQYAPLLASLDLTAQQVEAFAELMRGENLFGDFGPNGEFMEFWTRRDREVEATREQRLLELLGEKGFHAYNDFQRTTSGREFAAQLASQLSLSDTPLTPAQADQLVPLLSSVRGPSRYSAGNWDEVLAEAGPGLLPAQLATLRAIFESERKSAETLALRKTAAEALEENR